MVTADSSFVSFNTTSCLISNRSCSKQYVNLRPTFMALKKKDYSQNPTKEKKTLFPLQIANSRFLFQSAVGAFALGFIDAGYSGDWSRIGVISRGTEDLLKAAAFLVVPFCLFLSFSLFKKDSEE